MTFVGRVRFPISTTPDFHTRLLLHGVAGTVYMYTLCFSGMTPVGSTNDADVDTALFEMCHVKREAPNGTAWQLPKMVAIAFHCRDVAEVPYTYWIQRC